MANSLHASTVPCPLYISGLFVDFSKSAKSVESADVRISKLHAPVQRAAGKTLRHTFSPPIKLSVEDSFSLRVQHKRFGINTKYEDINFDTEYIFRVSGARGEPETQGITRARAVQPVSSGENPRLQPTTDEIIWIYPWFRILVIGKTSISKTSPINHAFGVGKATASHNKPGEASIDHEFISQQNNRFVLHDSKGSEPGEQDNLEIV